MARARFLAAPLALVALAGIPSARGQETAKFDLSAGYQWVDVSGNNDMYKTQVNERDGFVLGNLTLLVTRGEKRTGLFDRIRLDAYDIGAAPQSRVRFEARRDGAVGIRMSYFRAKHFSALPAFANPFISDGIVPGEHTLDRRLESFDVEVQVLPWRCITPIVGYRWDRVEGPSRTTVHVGQNEFHLRSDLDETTRELRAGFAFAVGTFRGSVMQGWRSVDSRQRSSLLSDAGEGNSSVPVFGVDETLSAYSRSEHVEIDAPTTMGSVTGRIGNRVRVVGTYITADVDADMTEDETLTGDLVSFELRGFFGGLQGTTASHAGTPYWRGKARVEADLVPGLELSAGYVKRHRELDGSALIDELYLGTASFGGIDKGDVAGLISADTAFARDDTVFDVRLEARRLGPIRAWAAWQRTGQDVTITPAAAELVIPGGQGGVFDRDIDRATVGAGYKEHGFDVSAEYQNDSADAAIVRTDLIDRDRWRFRAGWGDGKYVRFMANANLIEGSDDKPGVDYRLKQRVYGGEVEVTPVTPLAIRASYGKFKTDTSIPVRDPVTFATFSSAYSEDGELVEGSVSWRADRWSLGGGYSRFANRGDRPLALKAGWARATVDLTKASGLAFEFDDHEYSEDLLELAEYKAKRYVVLVRWHN
jgi:hypothetical protein